VWLEGPAGEGKTFSAIAAFFRHRRRMVDYYRGRDEKERPRLPYRPVRPMQVAIVRDTHQNLKTNTLKSIQRAFPGLFAFRDDAKKMFRAGCDIADVNAWYEKPDGDPPTWIDASLFGMDDLKSLDRIQGGEYDLIWIEEPAPILSSGNNGIREEVYLVCAQRIRGTRNPEDPTDAGTPKRLQISMNPADEEHWTSRQQDDPIIPSLAVYRIKRGENVYLSEVDRDMTAKIFAGRADLHARFVEGRRAKVYDGVAVTPEFNEGLHVAKEWILPDPNTEVLRMWDGGLNPACVLAQITPSGRLHFLDSILGQNIGMEQLIETKLKYVLGRPRYQRIKRYRDIGDPSLVTPEQANSDYSASKIIEEKLKTSFEQGIASWQVRREAWKWVLTQMPGGVPMVQVSPRVTEGEKLNWIRGGLAGGYCYKVTPDGRVVTDVPLKNLFSHPCDAVSHAIAHIWFRPKEPVYSSRPRAEQQKRAKGYAVG
jgi:hypothetical protein